MKGFRPDRHVVPVCFAALMLAASVLGAEMTIQNDSLVGGQAGSIQAGFVSGESAAAWLTSPCAGNIVAVQVFWRSYFGGEPETLGDTVTVFAAGDFPAPGAVMHNGYAPYQDAVFEGPVLSDGVINEFRYLDEYQTIPLQVPISAGQVFIVSFKFFDDVPLFGPSVITDSGCQSGKNALFAVPGGWLNSCEQGLSGDFVIRAVVNCEEPAGACCHASGNCESGVQHGNCQAFGDVWTQGSNCAQITCNARGACCRNGSCLQLLTQAACQQIAGVYAGNGSNCDNNVCVAGACCMADGSCLQNFTFQCAAVGGVFHGPGTSCTPNPCPQPVGACCFDTTCIADQTQVACTRSGGDWVGPLSTCGPPNPCQAPAGCPGDSNCDDGINWRDIDYFVAAMSGEQSWRDMFSSNTPSCPYTNSDVNGDGAVSWRDIDPFVARMNAACP